MLLEKSKKFGLGLRSELLLTITVLVVGTFSLLGTVFAVAIYYGVEFENTKRILLLLLAADLLVIILFGSLVLTERVVRPLRQLLDATEKVTQGRFDAEVRIDTKNEIGELARAFQKMVQSLKLQKELIQDHVKALERVNQQLTEAQSEVIRAEKWASIGRLAAGVAHEIGNPLSAVQGYVEILKKRGDEPIKDYSQRMSQELNRIHRIIRELVDFSRQREITLEKVDVSQVVQDTVELLKHQGLLKKIDCEVSTRSVPSVMANSHQLQQVFVNLIVNAVDAMSRGGKIKFSCDSICHEEVSAIPIERRRRGDPPDVDFSATRRVREDRFRSGQLLVRIQIQDTGCGISSEDLYRIFDPFFTTKEPGKGTGLGLAICQRIVDSFEGAIRVQSVLNQGTTFTILLPAVESEEKGE
jgi:signal transduction histidine kinase